jgi:hypothetical protein
LVSSRSLPAFRPAEREARRRLPSRGSRGPWFPTCTGTLLRSDCRSTHLGSLRSSRASRYLACCRAFVVSLTGAGSGGSPRPRQGLWSPGPLVREYEPGERWLSHVPELPLWRPAPVSDPGGVPHPRQNAPGTVAFRCVQTVGFPLRTAVRDILLSTTRLIAGLHHAACLLVHSSCVRPLLGWHVACTPDRLARRSSGGTYAVGLAPTG